MMKSAFASMAVAVMAVFAGHSVIAQPLTRSEVRQEAAEANTSGEIAGTPQGQPQAQYGQTSPQYKAQHSQRSAEQVRRDAARANEAGLIPHTEAQWQNPE